jgi:hypothetical protein
MQRKGMMVGSGRKGYYNIIGKDPMVHSLSAKGIKQPQRLGFGSNVKARFTQAKGQVVSTKPFAVKYQYKGDKYVKFSNPKYWQKGGKQVIVWKDTRYGDYEVYDLQNTDKLLGSFDSEKELRSALKRHKWQIGGKCGGKTEPTFAVCGKGIGDEHYPIKSGFTDENEAREWAKKEFGSMRNLRVVEGFKGNSKGGKDMPVTEIEDFEKKLDIKPKKRFNGERLKKAASGAYSFIKEEAKKGREYLAERKATQKAKELATDVENKGLATAYLAQKARVETLKQQIAERKESGGRVDDLITELGKEEKDYREIQEKVADVSVKAMSDGQLKELAVRTTDESIFSIGGGNQYERELLRRIAKRKELQQKVEKAEKEPVKSESIFDF